MLSCHQQRQAVGKSVRATQSFNVTRDPCEGAPAAPICRVACFNKRAHLEADVNQDAHAIRQHRRQQLAVVQHEVRLEFRVHAIIACLPPASAE